MATDTHSMKMVKRYENKLPGDEFDLTKESLKENPFLKNFGHDRLSYAPEKTMITSHYWAENEAKMAHGYPNTHWLQMGMVYGAGWYTAKQQGIIGAGKFMVPFWKHHYFDFIGFF